VRVSAWQSHRLQERSRGFNAVRHFGTPVVEVGERPGD
jgi:hypothetical protein